MAIKPRPHTEAKPAPEVKAPAKKKPSNKAVKKAAKAAAKAEPKAAKPAKPAKEAKPVKAEKPAKAPKASKAPKAGGSVNSRINELLLSKKHTDEEIHETLTKELGDFPKDYISSARWTLNQGLTDKLERFVRVGEKLTPKSKAPKKAPKAAARKVVDPEKDPLKKLAGIDVHKNKPVRAARPRV